MIETEHDFLGWCVSCDKARMNTTHIKIGYESGGRQIVRADISLCPRCAEELAEALHTQASTKGAEDSAIGFEAGARN